MLWRSAASAELSRTASDQNTKPLNCSSPCDVEIVTHHRVLSRSGIGSQPGSHFFDTPIFRFTAWGSLTNIYEIAAFVLEMGKVGEKMLHVFLLSA